jgi:predicted RNase H-like HicB family nuclease
MAGTKTTMQGIYPQTRTAGIAAAGRDYRCHIRRDGDGYRVTCPAVPPAIAFGATLEEARANAREELEGWIDAEEKGEVARTALAGFRQQTSGVRRPAGSERDALGWGAPNDRP